MKILNFVVILRFQLTVILLLSILSIQLHEKILEGAME